MLLNMLLGLPCSYHCGISVLERNMLRGVVDDDRLKLGETGRK